VPEEAEPVTREIEIVTDRPGWDNTGIYANAGSPHWHSTGPVRGAGPADHGDGSRNGGR
jgi:hypothetical protein